MMVKFSRELGYETVWIFPSTLIDKPRVVVYHTGGGETARVLADDGNEKRGIFARLAESGYVVTSVTSTPDHWGSPLALRANDALLSGIRSRFDVEKIGVMCQSMGGLSAYIWSCRNPEVVVGIYGVYPVTNLGSRLKGSLGSSISKVYTSQGVDLGTDLSSYDPIKQIGSLVRMGVPAKHRHGDADALVEYGANARKFAEAYDKLGGNFELVTVQGLGHQADPDFFKPEEVLDFMDSLKWDT